MLSPGDQCCLSVFRQAQHADQHIREKESKRERASPNTLVRAETLPERERERDQAMVEMHFHREDPPLMSGMVQTACLHAPFFIMH